jgi:two-component system chemotaxis response regulator CheY
MEGKIYLDDEYNSGIPGYPGTRFVVDLQTGAVQPPLAEDYPKHLECIRDGTSTTQAMDEETNSLQTELPEEVSILFVDDDAVLRKLFRRAIKMVRPNWTVREASNGETALQLIETTLFDLIFVDMYMASVEKQLLGTETVSALRARGVSCRICGLSANDKEEEFYDAGANAFMFKPFPCDPDALTRTLNRVLYQD